MIKFEIRPNVNSVFPFEVWKRESLDWVLNAAFLVRTEAAAWIMLNTALDNLVKK